MIYVKNNKSLWVLNHIWEDYCWLILNPYRFSPNYTFRFLTSSFRHLPHFLIIGTSKAGKHSVLSYINQHPDIKAGTKHDTGVYYFDTTFEYKSLAWYKSHFPSKFSKFKIIGEASGTYLTHPLAPERIKKTLPRKSGKNSRNGRNYCWIFKFWK